jgi:cytoskeletal protein CcmA (bactofilin family)
MLNAKKNFANGKKSGSAKFFELQNIEITKEADFRGDICAKSIAIENGAFFKGSVELINEPPQKTFSTEQPAASKAEA